MWSIAPTRRINFRTILSLVFIVFLQANSGRYLKVTVHPDSTDISTPIEETLQFIDKTKKENGKVQWRCVVACGLMQWIIGAYIQ